MKKSQESHKEITRDHGIKIFQGAKEIQLKRKSYNHLSHE